MSVRTEKQTNKQTHKQTQQIKLNLGRLVSVMITCRPTLNTGSIQASLKKTKL